MSARHDAAAHRGERLLSAAARSTLRDHAASTQVLLQDARQIEIHLRRLDAARSGIAALVSEILRLKLKHARILEDAADTARLAIGNSLVRYKINADDDRTALLLYREQNAAIPDHIAVQSLLGATILGMREGQGAPLLRSDHTFTIVRLLDVITRPKSGRLSPHRRKPMRPGWSAVDDPGR